MGEKLLHRKDMKPHQIITAMIESSIASFIFIYHYVSSTYHTVESHRNYTLVFTVADYNVGKAMLHQKDKETTYYMRTLSPRL